MPSRQTVDTRKLTASASSALTAPNACAMSPAIPGPAISAADTERESAGVQCDDRDERQRHIRCRAAALAHRLPEPQQLEVALPEQAGSPAVGSRSQPFLRCLADHLSCLGGRAVRMCSAVM